MAASEAAVTAVMETLGCGRYRREYSHPEPFVYDYCNEHSAEGERSWTDRGCRVAVAAADAAVDADRASIQAETLREVKDLAERWWNEAEYGEGERYGRIIGRTLRSCADELHELLGGCCSACKGEGYGYGGEPCWDCRGTGHPHPRSDESQP